MSMAVYTGKANRCPYSTDVEAGLGRALVALEGAVTDPIMALPGYTSAGWGAKAAMEVYPRCVKAQIIFGVASGTIPSYVTGDVNPLKLQAIELMASARNTILSRPEEHRYRALES